MRRPKFEIFFFKCSSINFRNCHTKHKDRNDFFTVLFQIEIAVGTLCPGGHISGPNVLFLTRIACYQIDNIPHIAIKVLPNCITFFGYRTTKILSRNQELLLTRLTFTFTQKYTFFKCCLRLMLYIYICTYTYIHIHNITYIYIRQDLLGDVKAIENSLFTLN